MALATGAIGGALGGAAAFALQGVGSVVTRFALETVSDMVVDTGISLATGQFSWENLGVSTLMSVGMNTFTSGLSTRTRAGNFQGRMMGAGEAFGGGVGSRLRGGADVDVGAPGGTRAGGAGVEPEARPPRTAPPEAEPTAPGARPTEAEGGTPCPPEAEAEPAGPRNRTDVDTDKPANMRSDAELEEAGVPVKVGDADHTLKPVRIGDQVELALCSTCTKLTDQIDGMLAKISENGPTKSLHRRLAKLRQRVAKLQEDINSGNVPFNRIPAEANQVGAHLRDLGNKFREFQQGLGWNKMSRPSPGDYDDLAGRLGFQQTNYTSHRQPVYRQGNRYITPDVDKHSGGIWKMADSVRNLGSKRTRMGTYDENLNRIGD